MWCLALCLALASPRFADSRVATHGAAEDVYRLPEGFLFGAGSSSYQVEGAWDADGKGVNVFDHSHHQNNLNTSQTADIAADFYHRYKEDIDFAAKLGLNAVRVSLAWARIFPTGRNNVNPKGVQFYHDVLDYMISKNIEPIVTIFHFDYPQTLEDEFGGWLSDKMPQVFAQFSDFVFSEYGSKVKYWLTVNEAGIYCEMITVLPPGTVTGETVHICLHNLLLAHALAHKIYEEKYKAKFKGMVGFGVGPTFFRPASDSEADRSMADFLNLGTDSGIGLSIDALVFGDYPEIYRGPGKPTFSEEQKNLIRGRIDWVGINMYTGFDISVSDNPWIPSTIRGLRGLKQNIGASGTSDIISLYLKQAWILREVPRWIRSRYGDLPVFFTENGMSTGRTTDDWSLRAVYCSAFLREMAAGINVDGNNVVGYTMWAITDTFEFIDYSQGWGLVHVDFESGSLNRTLKTSAPFFRRLTRTWTVPLVEKDTAPFHEDFNDNAQSTATSTLKPDISSAVSSTGNSALLAISLTVARTLLQLVARVN